MAGVGRETLQFQSAVIPADMTFIVTRIKGKQLVVLLDYFHSHAYQPRAKRMKEPQAWPLLCTLKKQKGALCNGYTILNITMDTTLMKSTDALKNYFLCSFCRLTYLHELFLTFRMAADSIFGSICIKMHDPKTQGSTRDPTEASIHPVSAVHHTTSEGVKSNQYLEEEENN